MGNIINFFKDFKKGEKSKPSSLTSSKGYNAFLEGQKLFNNSEDDNMALEKFIQAEKEGYISAEMYADMAWIYGWKKDFKRAEYYVRMAIEMDSDYGYSYYILAEVYEDYYKNPQKAFELFLLAEKKGCSQSILYDKIIDYYMAFNNPLKAIDYANKALDKEVNVPYFLFIKGWLYHKLNEHKKALKYYLKAEDKGYGDDDNNVMLYVNISICYNFLNNLNKAHEYVNKALFKNKNEPEGYAQKGFLYYYEGKGMDKDKALKYLLQAESLNSKSADVYGYIAAIYIDEKKEYEKAFEYANKAAKLDKYFYTVLGHLYYEQGDYKKSYKYYKKAYKYNAEKFTLWQYFDMIASLKELNCYKLALKYVEEAIKIFPKERCFKCLQLELLAAQNKMNEEYIHLIEDFNKKNPDIVESRIFLVECYANKKEYDKGIEIINKIIKDFKNNKDIGVKQYIQYNTLWFLAYLYLGKKDYEKALDNIYKFTVNYDHSLNKNAYLNIKKIYKKLIKKLPGDKRLDRIRENFKLEEE